MNSHLQRLYDLIKQSAFISAEDKSVLEKAIHDTEKELEILSFKLDRTEKVKHTTAILLEETIQELEQKRKAVKLQNRELEIETSLERVRSVAMGMQQPADMLDVCRIISDQLQLLQVADIRNVQTAIIDGDKGTYINYQYFTSYQQVTIEEVEYNKHPKVLEFVLQMQQSADAFFSGAFVGEELEVWRQYRKDDNQFPDPILDEATAVFYYFYSIGHGGLGISTYAPLNEEAIHIFKRFRNVFDLAYRRFIDIQKAEAQTRESQIQLALERVRARTMAMQKSDELPETSHILFEQMKELGEPADQLTIGIVREEDKVIEISATLHGNTLKNIYRHSIEEPYVMNKVYKAWKMHQKTLIVEVRGEELNAYNQYRNELTHTEMFPTTLSEENRRIVYAAFFSKGMLALGTNEPRPPQSLQLLERFASVFDLTYTRFLDLEKAETQAREAQIELAVEKVRAKALAMHKSEDLHSVVVTLKKELMGLRIPNITSATMYLAQNDGSIRILDLSDTGADDEDKPQLQLDKIFRLEETDPDLWIRRMWNRSDNYFVLEADEADFVRVVQWIRTVDPAGAEIAEKIIKEKSIKKAWLPTVKLEKGRLNIDLLQPPTDEIKPILLKMGAGFDLAYRRFLDLKQAESLAQQAELDLIKLKEEKKRTDNALAELKATQSQLIQSEKMASLGELTAGIAHEIQNPLNFVNNFAEVSHELIDEMFEELNLGHAAEVKSIANDLKQNLEKINQHGKRADAIVKGMLQHSRSSSGVTEPTDVNALVDEYLRLAYHGLRAKDKSFNVTMKTDYDERIGLISIIPQDFGRVILNLITNAFYAVTEKKQQHSQGYEPTVSVTTRLIKSPVAELTARMSKGVEALGHSVVEVRVKDNGNGIPQNILDKIFQPFYTTKPTGKGTGLGLSLSYDIVKAHGGKLKVETKENEGAEFIIQLPGNIAV